MFLWEVRKAMSKFLARSCHGQRERKEERREHPPEPWRWWGSAKLSLVTGGWVVSVVLGMFWFFECHWATV